MVERILTKLMFDAPSDSTIKGIKITAECVRDGADPEIIRREAEEDKDAV